MAARKLGSERTSWRLCNMANRTVEIPSRNLTLDLVQATEAAALAASRWVGLGQPEAADREATERMYEVLNLVDIEAAVAVGEEVRIYSCDRFESGQCFGTGQGPTVDVVVDPIDGRKLVAEGSRGAISVLAVAPRDSLWQPRPAAYMEKVVVDTEVADAIVPEVLDAPAAWTLALVGRAKHKKVEDLTVFILNRRRHKHLIAEVREAGAHVILRDEGDVTGALLAGSPDNQIDLLMGVGGVSEGLIAACALRATNGAMVARLSPQSKEERAKVLEAGHNLDRILLTEEIVTTDEVIFVGTGITDGPLLSGVRHSAQHVESSSLVMLGTTKTRRLIETDHLVVEEPEPRRRYVPEEHFG
jgi:fructose-1,6-bisphosphatase II